MNARGSALVEASLAVSCVTTIVSATLIAAYVIFGRAWIEFQSERALHCLGEGRGEHRCRKALASAVTKSLPYGRIDRVEVFTTGNVWSVSCTWSLLDFKFRVNKSLSPRRVTGRVGS